MLARAMPCGVCCCPTIGFDASAWGEVVSCCPGMSAIINLKDAALDDLPGLLDRCKVLFAGVAYSCLEASIKFSSDKWQAIYDWLGRGGRMWLQLEYTTTNTRSGSPAVENTFTLDCLSDRANALAFLAYGGLTNPTYTGGNYESMCAANGTRDCVPGSPGYAITQGVTLRMAYTGEIFGGLDMWRSPNGVRMVQANTIGGGILFVTGDAMLTECGVNGNCNFTKRLWEMTVDEMLA